MNKKNKQKEIGYDSGLGWFHWDNELSFKYGYFETKNDAEKALSRYYIEVVGVDMPSSYSVDQDLKDHHDPNKSFKLDIGGEG
tara:strand:+ start:1897 stop:2145 length:249 start_codon:yes stop_codon:yes gene_type:complete